jgi:hypothetical protein
VHFAHDIKGTPRALLSLSPADKHSQYAPLSNIGQTQNSIPCHIPICKVSYATARAGRVLYPESTKTHRARSYEKRFILLALAQPRREQPSEVEGPLFPEEHWSSPVFSISYGLSLNVLGASHYPQLFRRM